MRWGDEARRRLATLPGGADVLVTPCPPDPPALVGAQRGLPTLATSGRVVPLHPAWNVTGQPAISVPAGHTDAGLPLAVQLVGQARRGGPAAGHRRAARGRDVLPGPSAAAALSPCHALPLASRPARPAEGDDVSVMDRFRLDDRVVIVTGASSGLGVAFRAGLRRGRARTWCSPRARADRLEDTAGAGQVRRPTRA
jgi:hypothetical protein